MGPVQKSQNQIFFAIAIILLVTFALTKSMVEAERQSDSEQDFRLYRKRPIHFESDESYDDVRLRIDESGEGHGRYRGQRNNEFGKVNQAEIKRKLCPNETGPLDQFRYDASAGRCAQQGQQGHCGENMKFYGVTHNDLYGECDCYYDSLRPLVYHVETKRCYFVYDQAYCRRGEWLTFGNDGKTSCSFNKCQTPSVLKERVYVPLNGSGPCVLLDQTSTHCESSDEVVTFVAGQLTPKCAKLVQGIRSVALSRQLKCKPGMYLNIVGKCQPPFTW